MDSLCSILVNFAVLHPLTAFLLSEAEDGWIYAWNITTGQLLWKFNPGTPDSSWSWSLSSSYGMIYGHNQDTHFYAVNATTGKEVWVAL